MKNKVAIIGGGYTGMVAAYYLARAGHKVALYERGDNLGGLASGFKIEGANIEKAYHHLFKTDIDIIEFTNELGIKDALEWHDSSVAIYYQGNIYPFMGAIDLIKFSPLRLIDRFRTGLVIFYLQKEKKWQKFKSISAYQWMEKYCGKRATEVIWYPLLKGKFSNYYKEVAMAWLWARLHIRANSREGLFDKEQLGYFRNGFETFTATLTEKLKYLGVEIIYKADISAIKAGKEGVNLLVNGSVKKFDKILATVPSDVFARLTDSAEASSKYINRLRQIEYLGAVLLVFSSEQDLGEHYWHNINDTGAPFLVFINHTKLIDKSQYNNKCVYYIGSYIPHDHEYFRVSDATLKKDWYKGLKKIFPEFDEKAIREENIFRFKNAQHIAVKDYDKIKPEYKTHIDNVYLANFSQIYPEDRGTNYAVREGKKIATKILKDMQKF